MRQTLAIGSGTAPAQARGIAGDFEVILNAGSTADTATPITTSNVLVTTSGAGGVRLFAPTPGDKVNFVNASGSATTLYPHSGGTINGTTTLSFATAKGAVLFAVSATDWRSIPVVPT